MDILAVKASFESMVLWGCAGVSLLMGMAVLGVVACKSPGKILEVARKRGWLYVIVMGVFVAVATDAGSPTQEDKERDRMMRRQQAAEDAAWGAALGIGGLDAMDAEHRRLDATLAGTRPSGGRSEGMPEGALSASPETVDAAEGAVLPSVRPLTDSDYAAGIALARIGTNEVWDFSAPAGAEICMDWLEFGAEKDWFKTQFTNSWSFAFGTNTVDAMTVYSYGLSRPVATNAATFFAPMRTRLGVARAANWEQLAELDRPSQFWQFLTPSNTLVMTWQNVLLDRASDRPVSFQMEFWENGDVMFRYDLSRLAEDVVTNLVVGISNAGEGRVFTALAKNTTSLRWVHLDPTRPFEADPDNDGVTTEDEILVHGTDPYAADTDLDGLSDGREIGETNTAPLDPHSVDPRYPDGMAVVIGDLDPFSCPPGSTNTVWEHVFYTGTTNRPFAYPVSSDGNAVLRVTVSGSGSGELIVGDQVVPLLGMPSEPSSRMMARSGSGERPGNAHDLLVSVGHGVVRRAVIRGSADLALDYQSGDYCIGVRPTWLVPVGWFAFPNTKASEPCIHDLNAKRVAVSLDPGPEIEGLTCTWIPEANLEVDGRPPLSALLTGSFSRDATQQATYRLDHPHELFGQKVYSQTARFCPRKEPGSADDPSPAPGEGGHSSTEDSDPTESYQPECWCWSDCEWCDCPCHWNPDVPNTSVDPDNCPLHSMPYEQCEPMHGNSYHAATNSTEQVEEVLKLHRPLHEQDHSCLSIKVPTEWVQCCDCPDHWTNYVSVAYKSHRIAAHLNGQPFDRTVRDGILDVYGVLPSSSFGDATLSLCKTGHVYEARTWSRSVFKKLWFSGLDRGFIAVTWYGNEGQLGWGSNVVTFNYYGNVQNAFESAHHYKQQMDQVPGPKWFLAHSLGNMLTSAAIQDYGMPYERYFLLNAAIAKEAFEPVDGITVESHDNMTPRAWTNYTDRVRATHWFERFPEGDGRRLLTWKGRFNTVTNIVNFYSSEEEVVNNGDGESHSLADRLYVWYNQETRKGAWHLMWHEYEGGWAFNPYYDVTTNYWIGSQSYSKTYHMPSADADNLTDPQLQARPFFLDFANPQMHSSSNGFIVATDYSYRAEMLAYAIPAESYAVGANSIGWLLTADECLDSPELQGNFDMAVEFGNGREDLPLGTTPESNKQRWVHSTFAQRSYKRTRQLFKKIVDKMEGGR